MSHPHNPDTWIVPAPKCRLVDGSLPERDIPDQAMPSLKHLYPATSAVISPVGSAHPQKEVCGQMLIPGTDVRTQKNYGGAIPPRPEDRGPLAHVR